MMNYRSGGGGGGCYCRHHRSSRSIRSSSALLILFVPLLMITTSCCFVDGFVVVIHPFTGPHGGQLTNSNKKIIHQLQSQQLQHQRSSSLILNNQQPQQPFSPSRLHMYNLPPGGGDGNRGGGGDIGPIITSTLTLIGIIAFFLSPLGGFVLGIFNSLFLLALAAPLVGIIAFQVWSKFNIIQGPCPNCGAPSQVAKRGSTGDANDMNSMVGNAPTLCLNCGAIIQASTDNKSIELVNIDNTNSGVVGDGTMNDGSGLFDSLFGTGSSRPSSPGTAKGSGNDSNTAAKQRQRQGTVIDVEVEE